MFSDAPRLQAGQSITLLIDLDSDLRSNRGIQVKIITTNGGVFVGTIFVGNQAG